MTLTAFHFEWPKNLAGESLAPSRQLAREMRRRTQALIDLSSGDLYFYGGLLTDVGAEEIDRVLNLLELMFDGTILAEAKGTLIPAASVMDHIQVLRVRDTLVVLGLVDTDEGVTAVAELVQSIGEWGIAATDDFPNKLPILG